MIASVASGIFVMAPMVGGCLLAYGIFQVVMDLRSSNQEKVLKRLTEGKGHSKQRQVKESLLRSKGLDVQKNFVEAILTRLHLVIKLQRVLDQANVDWSATRVLLNTAGASVLVGVVLMFARVTPVGCVGAGLGTFVLPMLYLLFLRGHRIKKLVGQLPDVFELMGQALRAGHSLASAIQLVSEQMPDPIAGEFALVFHEQNLGIKIEDALLNMGDRVDQMDVRFFVTAVLIQRQTGGDLAEVLDKIGKVIRDRIQLFGAVKALTAEGRLSGAVLLLLPVLVFFISMSVNPSYARMLLDTPNGRIMLGIAICMDLMGMAMIKMIVNIKV